MKRKTNYGVSKSLKVNVVSDEEAEQAQFIVCSRADVPTPFKDNLFGLCCRCGSKVQFRWHAPRKPKRICLECMIVCGGNLNMV